MKPAELSRILSVGMLMLGLGGAIYSAFEWIHAPASISLKYVILFVMWLVLAIGWGSRLIPDGTRESRKQ
jgi:hypothetical protein